MHKETRERERHPLHLQIYCIWMNLIFMGIIPFVLLIVLNSLMLRSLVRQNRSRSENAANMMLCNAKEVALAKVSGAEITSITRLTFS